MRQWLKQYSLWLWAAALAFSVDWGLSSLATCIGGEQQQANQCTEKSYGFFDAVTIRIFFWFVDLVDAKSDFFQAASAVVVAIFTITLWRATTGLLRVAHEQSDISNKQMLIAARQTDIQEKQHAIGRLQFIADKRPRLRVRHVHLHPDVQTKLGDPDTVVNGSLVVVNVGGTDARILQSRYRVFWSEFGLPMDLDMEGPESFQLAGVAGTEIDPIKGGESCSYYFHAADPLKASANDVELGNCQLFVVGYVRYADENDTERFMGFCRKHSLADGNRGNRFIAVDDPDYEYED